MSGAPGTALIAPPGATALRETALFPSSSADYHRVNKKSIGLSFAVSGLASVWAARAGLRPAPTEPETTLASEEGLRG
jgi:hypothetical protein